MANRSDEVFIYLRAIGAAKTRRDIESVADSLERLEKGTEGHTEAVDDLTEAQDLNTKSQKQNKKATKDSAIATNDAEAKTRKLNTTLIKTNDTLKGFTVTTKGMIKNSKEYSKEVSDAYRIHEQYRKKERIAQEKQGAAWAKMYSDAYKENEKFTKKQNEAWTRMYETAYKDHARFLQKETTLRRQQLRIQERFDAAELRRQDKYSKQRQAKADKDNKAMLRQGALIQKAKGDLSHAIVPNISLPSFPRKGFIVKWAALIMGVLDLIPVIGTALNASLAGAVAAVNGLMPMMSLFGALPAGILAMAQFGIVAQVAFNNVGAALGGNATALKKLTPEARRFVESITNSGLKDYWKDLKANIQEAAFTGLTESFRSLTQKYMPLLNEQLTRTSTIINEKIRGGMDYLTSSSGFATMDAIIKTNNVLIESALGGIGQFIKAFLNLGVAGGSVMTTMMDDFERLGTYLAILTGSNINGISDYFDRAYTSAKRAGHIVGNFLGSLYNIFKLSSPLTKHLADNLDKASDNLLKWTKSEAGIKAIKDYFAEMKPNLDALGNLAGTLVKAIFRISRSKNFKEIADTMSDKLVPAFERLIKSIDGQFVLLLVNFIDHLSVLADSGLAEAIIDIGNVFVDIVGKIAEFYSSLGDGPQKALVWSVVLIGFFGGFATKAIAYIGGIMKAWKTLQALLGRGAKIGGVTGGVPAANSKAGKAAAATGARRAAAGPVSSGKTGGKASRASGGGGGRRISNTAAGAGAVAGALALPLMGAFIGDTSNKLDDVGASASAAAGDINRFFQTANGGSLAPANAQWSGTQAEVNNLDSALARITQADWGTRFGDKLSSGLNTLAGTTSKVDQVKNAFAQLDTQMASLPAGQAEANFNKIRVSAEKQKIPMDKLVDLFPQLRDKMRTAAIQANGTAGKFDDAGFAAHAMGGDVGYLRDRIKELPAKKEAKINSIFKKDGVEAAYRALAAIDGNTATTYIRTNRITYYGTEGVPTNPQGDRFAGGMTEPGGMYRTGELGPEFTMTRSGKLGIVGLLGQQMFSPSEPTAIIPASATSNPMSGNYGNAPDWARSALQRSINPDTSRATMPQPKGGRGNSSGSHYDVNFSGATFGSNVDVSAVKEAVMSAINEAERDRRERR